MPLPPYQPRAGMAREHPANGRWTNSLRNNESESIPTSFRSNQPISFRSNQPPSHNTSNHINSFYSDRPASTRSFRSHSLDNLRKRACSREPPPGGQSVPTYGGVHTFERAYRRSGHDDLLQPRSFRPETREAQDHLDRWRMGYRDVPALASPARGENGYLSPRTRPSRASSCSLSFPPRAPSPLSRGRDSDRDGPRPRDPSLSRCFTPSRTLFNGQRGNDSNRTNLSPAPMLGLGEAATQDVDELKAIIHKLATFNRQLRSILKQSLTSPRNGILCPKCQEPASLPVESHRSEMCSPMSDRLSRRDSEGDRSHREYSGEPSIVYRPPSPPSLVDPSPIAERAREDRSLIQSLSHREAPLEPTEAFKPRTSNLKIRAGKVESYEESKHSRFPSLYAPEPVASPPEPRSAPWQRRTVELEKENEPPVQVDPPSAYPARMAATPSKGPSRRIRAQLPDQNKRLDEPPRRPMGFPPNPGPRPTQDSAHLWPPATTTVPAAPKPFVVPSLRLNVVGKSSWFSGDATAGDTYH